MDRRTLGGWLEGPGAGGPDLEPQDFRGQRLGLPPEGVGSIAGVGRRLLALTIDWFVALFIGRLIFNGTEYPSPASNVQNLAIFAVMTLLLVWSMGSTIGHRLMGLRVLRLRGDGQVPFVQALVRTVLLCLVIPPAIWDRDLRGLHDKAAATVVVKAPPRPAR